MILPFGDKLEWLDSKNHFMRPVPSQQFGCFAQSTGEK